MGKVGRLIYLLAVTCPLGLHLHLRILPISYVHKEKLRVLMHLANAGNASPIASLGGVRPNENSLKCECRQYVSSRRHGEEIA